MKLLLFALLVTSLVGCTKQQPPPQESAQPERTTSNVQAPDRRISSGQKTVEAKALFEANQLDQAEQKCREAIKLNPTNEAAYYYLNLIAEKRRGR